jgi:hypothetical protein
MSTRNQRYARFAAARKQWGPTKADEEIQALGQLADERFDPENPREAATAISERAKANRAARGKQVFDTAQGRLVSADRGEKEAEKAVQRLGLSAEDYWERNPTSQRTVTVQDWSKDPEVAAAIKSGDISAIEKATKNARDRNRVARGLPKGPGTTEGDAAAGRAQSNTAAMGVNSIDNGVTVNTGRPALQPARSEVEVMDLAREYQAERANQQARIAGVRKKFNDNRLEAEADQLSARLKEKGLPNEPRKNDGSYDADKARGMLAQKTFDDWDYDKRLARDAVRAERDARGQLSDLRRKERRGAATPEDRLAMRDLERSVEAGEQERDGLRPGYWRSVAEDEARNKVAGVERSRILAESQEKQADAAKKRAEVLGRSLTAEELQQFGYPSWDDEAAWQELIKTNPAAAEVYKTKPVNVSRAGRAMSKALTAFV